MCYWNKTGTDGDFANDLGLSYSDAKKCIWGSGEYDIPDL